MVVRRPVLLRVWCGPWWPPVVMDHERRLMFSRTPGRMRKLLRNVRDMSAPPYGSSRLFVSVYYADCGASGSQYPEVGDGCL
jgi:hypothetical protein